MKSQLNPATAKGFTLIEILITVAIIGIILALALPNLYRARVRAQSQVCIENLAQIDSAKQLWGLEKNKREGEVPSQSDLIGPSLYIKKMPVCPSGGDYSFGGIGTKPTCPIEDHSL